MNIYKNEYIDAAKAQGWRVEDHDAEEVLLYEAENYTEWYFPLAEIFGSASAGDWLPQGVEAYLQGVYNEWNNNDFALDMYDNIGDAKNLRQLYNDAEEIETAIYNLSVAWAQITEQAAAEQEEAEQEEAAAANTAQLFSREE